MVSSKITTIKGQKEIKNINVGDLVLTSEGYKKVLKKFENGIKKPINTRCNSILFV